MPGKDHKAQGMAAVRREARGRGGGIQSIERGFRLIERVTHYAEGATLSELSRDTGLHSSTVFHLLKTLDSLGYLQQQKQTKRYRVGRRIYALAAFCLDENEMVAVAQPFVDRLAEATGESAHFALWCGEEVLIAARSRGRSPFQLNERAGILRPVHCTAIGKALLAGLSDGELALRLGAGPLAAFTPKTVTDPAELMRQIAQVRADGLAFDDSEYNEEARCIAAMVRDFSGRVIGAIGFSGPIWRVSLADLSRFAEHTMGCARALSAELGHHVPAAETPPGPARRSGAPSRD